MRFRPAILCVALLPALQAWAAVSAPFAGRLVNFSARGAVGTGDDTLILGCVLDGGSPQPLLFRGVGPTLSQFSVTNPAAATALTVYGPTPQTIGSGTNDPLATSTAQRVGAFELPAGSRDAATVLTSDRGSYTVHVNGANNATGTALGEIYDANDAGDRRLRNFSARARVGGSTGALIAGFVIDGTLPRRVLLRAAGPSLASAVPSAISDPQLALYRAGEAAALAQNDNWAGNATLKAAATAAGAFAFVSDSSRDAALIATLPPGAYTVVVNGVGSAAGVALVEIYDITATASAAPTIAAQPGSMILTAGASASLTVISGNPAPAVYQWHKNGALIPGATSDTLSLPNVQPADVGTYVVTVTNALGSIVSAPATVSLVAPPGPLPPAAQFNLVGFATIGSGATGGGVLATSDPNYRVLDASIPNRAQQLRTWLESTTPLVVDVQVDVDLGALNNVGNRPKTNPELVASGLGVINVRANKTVFSSTGATLRHGMFNISGQNNIIVRNLRFRGLWEFDEGSQNPPDNAPWGYKIQDWDYLTIQNGARNIWIDHCDFEKSYDGLADVKAAADLVTFSWCRFGGDTEGAVARQIAHLEKLYSGQITDSRTDFTFYRGLRDGAYAAQGIPRQSVADIVTHELPHDKGNLIGSSDTATGDIGTLNLTVHHSYYRAVRQRLPRMRFGNAHVFNLFVDNSQIVDGTNMGTATTCDAAVYVENSYYFEIADPFPPVSGTSPPGRITQTGSTWIYRGVNQSLATNTFLKNPATWSWNFGTKNFAWSVLAGGNPLAPPYGYTADPTEFTKDNLRYVGVIVPANAADQATLAGYLARTTH